MKRPVLLLGVLLMVVSIFSSFGESTLNAQTGCRIIVTWEALQSQNVAARDFFIDEWFWNFGASLSPNEPVFANFEWDSDTSASATFGPVHYYLAPTQQNPWRPSQPPVLLATTFSNTADVEFKSRISNLVEIEPSRNSSFVTADHADSLRVTCTSQASELLGAVLHDTYIGRHEFFYRVRIEPLPPTN